MATYIILGVLTLMIIAMITDKFEFGFAPIAACVILALFGIVTIQEAFSGFTNNYVIVTAGYLVLSDLFGRTQLITKIQEFIMRSQKNKSAHFLFLLLLVFTVILVMFIEPGPAILILTVLLSTIPSEGKISKMQMYLPIGTMCNLGGRKAPFGATLLFVVWLNGFLENAGYQNNVSVLKFVLMGIIPLIVAIGYSLVAYKLLPNQDIQFSSEEKEQESNNKSLSPSQEKIIYLAFAVSTISMFFSNQLGNLLYIIPIAVVGILCLINIISFKEIRGVISSPIIFMLAGIFSLADIMANQGITQMIGTGIQNVLGDNNSGWIVLFVFAFVTVIMANLTGSNIGTLMIMSPIAISAAMSIGVDPRAIGMAIVASANATVIMPMDTVMGLVVANGGYTIGKTFKYTIPLTIIYVIAICICSVLLYPF